MTAPRCVLELLTISVLFTVAGCDPAPTPLTRPTGGGAAASPWRQRFTGSYDLTVGEAVRTLHVVAVAPDGRITGGAEDEREAALRVERGRLTETGALSVVIRPRGPADPAGEAAGAPGGDVWEVEALLTEDEDGVVRLEGEVTVSREGVPGRRIRPLSGARWSAGSEGPR